MLLKQILVYFQTNSGEYFTAVLQHLALSFGTLLLAFIIAFPLGVIGSRSKMVAGLCSSFAQVLRIVPSLALLFILIPLIGVGVLPALVALVVLALPPLVINTILGFNEVDRNLQEVGLGLGMSPRQLFFKVQLPLALPYILNGVKLALVEVIASATLATYIGAGGLGTLIFTGLGLYRMDLLLIGGISVALLSLMFMFIFDLVIGKVKRDVK
ncbi:osmoprotectant transport system permease protein [Ligilactobacillus sp. WC1T17]|uniref:Osmoprotectant transport system permease protein n=1 Tax=Ligilactobacillus ruminis TaxID=1623 RepID=A0ABY1ACQ4_9LACO|nr:osmoprotectant transport system permease protein [Ligilactobacillus ruminis]